MYTAVRRGLIALSQSKVTFQSGGRKGLFKCLTIKLLRIPSTTNLGTTYLDDTQSSRIEQGRVGFTDSVAALQSRVARNDDARQDGIICRVARVAMCDRALEEDPRTRRAVVASGGDTASQIV